MYFFASLMMTDASSWSSFSKIEFYCKLKLPIKVSIVEFDKTNNTSIQDTINIISTCIEIFLKFFYLLTLHFITFQICQSLMKPGIILFT